MGWKIQYFYVKSPQIDLQIRINLSQNPAALFAEIDKSIVIFIWEGKEARIAKTTLKKKNKVGRLTVSDVGTYCKATVIKTVWLWHKDKH